MVTKNVPKEGCHALANFTTNPCKHCSGCTKQANPSNGLGLAGTSGPQESGAAMETPQGASLQSRTSASSGPIF